MDENRTFGTPASSPISDDPAFAAPAPMTDAPTFTPPAPAADVPTFTPPAPAADVPTFTPPAPAADVPTFTPPAPAADVPTFTPPAPAADVPTFAPPAPAAEAPTFAPPAPTFTPPVFTPPVFDGPSCYYHADEPAVSTCARCGRYICEDCNESYSVSSGEYEGMSLCYDCTTELVAENVRELKKNKGKILRTFIFTLIGMLFGGIVGASIGADAGNVGIGIFAGIFIGGCFWTFVVCWASRMANVLRGCSASNILGSLIGIFLGAIIAFVIEAVISIYRTIRKIIECLIYLKRTSGFIESDSAALQQMADYMEYTLVRNKNRGVDIGTLINQGGLADNAYAQMVLSQGESVAEANIRNCVATINENGEIIRSFAA